MGEIIKYNGIECKIGTMESLYYTTFQKFSDALEKGQLSKADHNSQPEEYVKADSGFRFRFPFPDEDHLAFGEIIGSYDRGIPILFDGKDDLSLAIPKEKHYIEVTGQKLVHRELDGELCLAMVYRDTMQQQSFRVEDENSARGIIRQLIKNHVLDEPDPDKKNFYRQIAIRILKGYKVNKLAIAMKKENKTKAIANFPPKRKANRKRGKSI
jgi:hypothetical protein